MDRIRGEAQRWDADSVERGADRPRLIVARLLTHPPERHVRAKRLLIELDRVARELAAYRGSERGRVVRAARHPEPCDARQTAAREATAVIELDVERRRFPRADARRVDDRREPIVGRAAKEREREMHELWLYTPEPGKVGECRGRGRGEAGRKRDRDE